jgi:AAA+ ATPase superfamily predicted ATPase
MKFVDRNGEISSLRDAYSAKSSNLVIIYGRRRIGKTELARHFGKEKSKCFAYYLCDESLFSEQLRRISIAVGEVIGDTELMRMGAASLEAIFYKVSKTASKKKFIIAIDEFPKLAKLDKAVPSTLQRAWDLYLKESGNLMLILSGSSISMMQDEALNYSSPLYGRSSLIFKLGQIGFRDIMLLAPKNLPNKDKLRLYFIFGGVPAYYSTMASSIADYDNASLLHIVSQLFNPGSVFSSEPNLLLSEEVKNDRVYLQILELMSNGVNKPGEMASKAGVAHGNLAKYMGLLESIGLVKKEFPVPMKFSRKSKTGVYSISDNFIDFYFGEMKKYMGTERAPQLVMDDLDLIAGRKFESLCRELVSDGAIGRYDIAGRWWGSNMRKSSGAREEEIDVVAVNSSTKEALFAECKWSNRKVGIDVYANLKRKSQFVEWHNSARKERFALFSREGFSDEMIDMAKREKVLLFDVDAVLGLCKKHVE